MCAFTIFNVKLYPIQHAEGLMKRLIERGPHLDFQEDTRWKSSFSSFFYLCKPYHSKSLSFSSHSLADYFATMSAKVWIAFTAMCVLSLMTHGKFLNLFYSFVYCLLYTNYLAYKMIPPPPPPHCKYCTQRLHSTSKCPLGAFTSTRTAFLPLK
jgi:hypothetical protein